MIIVEYRDGHNPPRLQTYSSLLDLVKEIRSKDHEPPALILRKIQEDQEYWSGGEDVWEIVTPAKIKALEDHLLEMKTLMMKADDGVKSHRHRYDGAVCQSPKDCLMRHYFGTRADQGTLYSDTE